MGNLKFAFLFSTLCGFVANTGKLNTPPYLPPHLIIRLKAKKRPPLRVFVVVGSTGRSLSNQSASSGATIRQSPRPKSNIPFEPREVHYLCRPFHSPDINPGQRNNTLVTAVDAEALPRPHLGDRDIGRCMAGDDAVKESRRLR